MDASCTQATLLSYSRSYDIFRSFVARTGLGVGCYHAHPAILIIYLGYLKQQKMAASTARKHLSGIAHCLRVNLLPDFTKTVPVQKAMKGYGRQAKRNDLRLPISLDLLKQIFDVLPDVCHTWYETTLFRAAFTLTFAALLRVSEVAAVDKCTSGHALLSDNVTIVGDTLTLHLLSSKTDQDGQGATIRLRRAGVRVCPVETLEKFLAMRPPAAGVLFCHEDSRQGFVNPLTKYQFNAVLKKALSALNMGALQFSSHSFRIGAASHLAVKYDDATIIRLGRWSPRGGAHRCYIRDIEMPPFTNN